MAKEKETIGSPDRLGDVIKDVIWEQFINQIAVTAGEDFIKENNGLTLDLHKDAHMTRDEQVAFANSDKNLNLMDSSANRSKGDSSMSEWLNSERDGKKPDDRFEGVDKKKLLDKDKEARDEYDKKKKRLNKGP